jgi:hypothetical protein
MLFVSGLIKTGFYTKTMPETQEFSISSRAIHEAKAEDENVTA